MKSPLVSIRMITYNQAEYVGLAIESILRQRVNFEYELLIGEDASTDGTADIVDHYQAKYPDLIKVYHRHKNVGRKKNNYLLMKQCRGKYVAILEGDDFWDFDAKLQMQVDYLETHRDVVATTHNVKHIDKNGEKLDDYYVDFPMQKRHIYNKKNAMRCELLSHVSGIVYRNLIDILDKEQWKAYVRCKVNDDLKLGITLGMLGKVVYFENVWSCRRRLLDGDGWTAKYYQKNICCYLFYGYFEIGNYLKTAFGVDSDITENLVDVLKQANRLTIKSPTRENITVANKINIAFVRFLFTKRRGHRGR